MSPTPPAPSDRVTRFDASTANQALLLLELLLRAGIWSVAATVTLRVAGALAWMNSFAPESLARWRGAYWAGTTLVKMILVFNVSYLLTLVVLRWLIPTPRPGRYPTNVTRPDPNLLYACLVAILTKARYQAPFPAIFVSHLANMLPFFWLLRRPFGPNSQTAFFVEPNILDPWGITIGKNVVLGFGSTVAAHVQEKDSVVLGRTIIEDDVLIGAYAAIGGGAHIKRGALIRSYASVLPGSIIGEGEQWGGNPARRIREAPRGEAEAAPPPAPGPANS